MTQERSCHASQHCVCRFPTKHARLTLRAEVCCQTIRQPTARLLVAFCAYHASFSLGLDCGGQDASRASEVEVAYQHPAIVHLKTAALASSESLAQLVPIRPQQRCPAAQSRGKSWICSARSAVSCLWRCFEGLLTEFPASAVCARLTPGCPADCFEGC